VLDKIDINVIQFQVEVVMIPQVFVGDEYEEIERSEIAVGTVRLVGILDSGVLEGRHSNFGYSGYVKALIWSGRAWASLTRGATQSLGVKNDYDFQYDKEDTMLGVRSALLARVEKINSDKPFVFWWWEGKPYAKFSDMAKTAKVTK